MAERNLMHKYRGPNNALVCSEHVGNGYSELYGGGYYAKLCNQPPWGPDHDQRSRLRTFIDKLRGK